MKFQTEPIRLTSRMAITVDHDAGRIYNCLLVDATGVSIVGTEFQARELNGDEGVADDTLITVVPVAGFWGFLRRGLTEVIGDAGCYIDEGDTDLHGTGTTITVNQNGGTVKYVLVHFTTPIPANKDIVFLSSAMTLRYDYTVASAPTDVKIDCMCYPITEDFDPAAITWDDGVPSYFATGFGISSGSDLAITTTTGADIGVARYLTAGTRLCGQYAAGDGVGIVYGILIIPTAGVAVTASSLNTQAGAVDQYKAFY